jgi:dTDP-4-dehydrorhamnose 3,5-epimerase
MIFTTTRLPGVFIIDPELRPDERGFFTRTWCQREFAERGLNPRLVQCNLSGSKQRGTLRGLHYQAAPHAEAKVVSCPRGAIYDVVVDLRSDSPAFQSWVAVKLTAQNRRLLYIPEGCAHGFETLEDDAEVFYQMSEFYVPDAARGVRWNDPAFSIQWPLPVTVISERDRSYEDFRS